MSKVNDYNNRICLYKDNILYKLFTIWYYNDWWYFITDLFNNSDYEYIATKISTNWKKIREKFHLPVDYNNTYKISLSNPKISHHIDWNAHISWKWIISGYNIDWSSKGLSIKSWSLYWCNNWGPLFWFNIWVNMLNDFSIIEFNEKIMKKPHLIIPDNYCKDLRQNDDEKFNYRIDVFYIHKSELPENMNDSVRFYQPHKYFWLMELIPIKSPPESPFIFWIFIWKDSLIYNPDFFSYSWAPWIIQENWNWEILSLFLNKKWNSKFKTLDYRL